MLLESRVHDLYPSRLGDMPSLLRRHDPVAYRLSSRGPLTLQQLAHYERYGYLCLQSVFTGSELAHLAHAARALHIHPSLQGRPEVLSPGQRRISSIFKPHVFERTFEEVVGQTSVVRAVEQILGSPIYVHQARLDFGSHEAGDDFRWRADFEQWHVEDGLRRMRTVNMLLNLTADDVPCPALRVIAGSHLHFLSLPAPLSERAAEQSGIRLTTPPDLLACLISEHGVHEPTARLGTVVIFDSNLLYAFGLNVSQGAWSRLCVGYNSIGNTLVRPFSGSLPRPDFMAERQPRVL